MVLVGDHGVRAGESLGFGGWVHDRLCMVGSALWVAGTAAGVYGGLLLRVDMLKWGEGKQKARSGRGLGCMV